MAPTLVGQAVAQDFSAAINVPYASTAGNLLVASVQHQGVATVGISDDAGNAWLTAATTDGNGGVDQGLGTMFYVLNSSAITSLSLDATTSAVNVNLSEWSGLDSLRSAAAGYDDFPTSFQVTTSATLDDLVISMCANWNPEAAPPAVSGGWTSLTSIGQSSTQLGAAHQIAATTGQVGPTWSDAEGGSGKFGIVTTAFVPTPTAPTGPTVRGVMSGGSEVPATLRGVMQGGSEVPATIREVITVAMGGAQLPATLPFTIGA